MIGRGALFAALRDRMLLNTPVGREATFNSRLGVADWITNGTYLVQGCTRTMVTLHISHADFASASFSEVENLLNHCLEHLQELACKYTDTRRRSEAWATVAAYYLGFFSASVLLHLVGRPIVFLSREHLADLQGLAGSLEKPGQGAFEFRIGAPVSAIYIELLVTKTEKIHEATWKKVLSLIDSLRNDPAVIMQADEADFYDSLCTHAFYAYGISYDWPSSVRNQANYRPGFAYRLYNPEFTFNRFLEPWRLGTSNDVYETFRNTYLRCNGARDVFSNRAEMMLNVSVILYLIARELYQDLVSRRLTDLRWEQQRNVYRRKMAFPSADFEGLRI
jgi:hypothetical protein